MSAFPIFNFKPAPGCYCRTPAHERIDLGILDETTLPVCWITACMNYVSPSDELGLCIQCKIKLQHIEGQPED